VFIKLRFAALGAEVATIPLIIDLMAQTGSVCVAIAASPLKSHL
jgi:hypothetical protein